MIEDQFEFLTFVLGCMQAFFSLIDGINDHPVDLTVLVMRRNNGIGEVGCYRLLLRTWRGWQVGKCTRCCVYFVQPVGISGKMDNLKSCLPEEIDHFIKWVTLQGLRIDQPRIAWIVSLYDQGRAAQNQNIERRKLYHLCQARTLTF